MEKSEVKSKYTFGDSHTAAKRLEDISEFFNLHTGKFVSKFFRKALYTGFAC